MDGAAEETLHVFNERRKKSGIQSQAESKQQTDKGNCLPISTRRHGTKQLELGFQVEIKDDLVRVKKITVKTLLFMNLSVISARENTIQYNTIFEGVLLAGHIGHLTLILTKVEF